METITDEMEGSDVVARDVKVCLILSGQDYMTQVVQPITILFCIWKVMKYDSPTREPESVQDKTVIFAESFVVVTMIHYHSVMGDPNLSCYIQKWNVILKLLSCFTAIDVKYILSWK